jgi:glycosyltransferase involved in cell wall biosynthesis
MSTDDPAQPIGRAFLYLPYVDEQGTGMQRFGSEMIRALLRSGLDAQVLIGEVKGSPPWLEHTPHKVLLSGSAARMLPRPLAALARLLWVQFIAPLKARRGDTLVTLADRDLAIFPLMRQIAVAHDLTQARSLRQQHSKALELRVRLWIGALRRSERVIAISGATKDDLIRSFGVREEQIRVIYEGFDPRIFYPRKEGRSTQRSYLLYAGTLAPNKNIPFLLEVYSELRRRGLEIDLRLVGRYAPERAEELIAAVPLPYRTSVHFDGFVSDEELGEKMRGCTGFVFPSLSEGFGLAPVEAMACGAPVISSEATSLAEVVAEGGVLLSPTDSNGWVRELTRLLQDEHYRAELSRRALRRSEHFSWDEAARAYREVIENRLDPPGSRRTEAPGSCGELHHVRSVAR